MCEEGIEYHVVAVCPTMGNGDRKDEEGKLGGTVAVGRADVACPEGGVLSNVALVACGMVSG